MIQFNIHSIKSAASAAQPLLEGALQKYGFVPHLLGGLAEAPLALQAYLDLGALFEKTSLTPVEQQVVLLSASVENQCSYCVAAHSLIAKRMVKADIRIIDALRQQQPLRDPKLDALAIFTRAVVKQRGKATKKSVTDFVSAGYNRQQVLEVVLGVAMKTLSNYANDIIDTPLDAAFQAEAWATPIQCNQHGH